MGFDQATFFDRSKAFDCVDHDIPLSKLDYYGITNTTYLKNRY